MTVATFTSSSSGHQYSSYISLLSPYLPLTCYKDALSLIYFLQLYTVSLLAAGLHVIFPRLPVTPRTTSVLYVPSVTFLGGASEKPRRKICAGAFNRAISTPCSDHDPFARSRFDSKADRRVAPAGCKPVRKRVFHRTELGYSKEESYVHGE